MGRGRPKRGIEQISVAFYNLLLINQGENTRKKLQAARNKWRPKPLRQNGLLYQLQDLEQEGYLIRTDQIRIGRYWHQPYIINWQKISDFLYYTIQERIDEHNSRHELSIHQACQILSNVRQQSGKEEGISYSKSLPQMRVNVREAWISTFGGKDFPAHESMVTPPPPVTPVMAKFLSMYLSTYYEGIRDVALVLEYAKESSNHNPKNIEKEIHGNKRYTLLSAMRRLTTVIMDNHGLIKKFEISDPCLNHLWHTTSEIWNWDKYDDTTALQRSVHSAAILEK